MLTLFLTPPDYFPPLSISLTLSIFYLSLSHTCLSHALWLSPTPPLIVWLRPHTPTPHLYTWYPPFTPSTYDTPLDTPTWHAPKTTSEICCFLYSHEGKHNFFEEKKIFVTDHDGKKCLKQIGKPQYHSARVRLFLSYHLIYAPWMTKTTMVNNIFLHNNKNNSFLDPGRIQFDAASPEKHFQSLKKIHNIIIFISIYCMSK